MLPVLLASLARPSRRSAATRTSRRSADRRRTPRDRPPVRRGRRHDLLEPAAGAGADVRPRPPGVQGGDQRPCRRAPHPQGRGARPRLGLARLRPHVQDAPGVPVTHFVPCAPDTPRFSDDGVVGLQTSWAGGFNVGRAGCATLLLRRDGRRRSGGACGWASAAAADVARAVDSAPRARGTSTTETWDAFFSDFYLRAYAGDERDAQAESRALAAARLAGCEPGGDVLDVPCGFGRHTLPLARAGYRVVGVDRSRTLLDEARRRAGGERWPKFVRADYRELPFADESFDAALNLFTSLGYLGDEEDVEGAGARSGACCARAASSCSRRCTATGSSTNFSDNDWQLMGEGRLLLEQRTFDPVDGRRADDADADRRRAASASRAPSACASTARPSCCAMVDARRVRRRQGLRRRSRADPLTPCHATSCTRVG